MATKKISTTRMSSKGQVVIPENVRTAMGLDTGAEFLVLNDGDFVVLKTLSTSDLGDYRQAVSRINKEAMLAVGERKQQSETELTAVCNHP